MSRYLIYIQHITTPKINESKRNMLFVQLICPKKKTIDDIRIIKTVLNFFLSKYDIIHLRKNNSSITGATINTAKMYAMKSKDKVSWLFDKLADGVLSKHPIIFAILPRTKPTMEKLNHSLRLT